MGYKRKYTKNEIINKKNIPLCDDCNGIIRPQIVLYNEEIEKIKCWKTQEKIQKCEGLIVLGSTFSKRLKLELHK